METIDKYFKTELKRIKTEIGDIYFSLFSLRSKEDLISDLEYLYNLYLGKDNYYEEEGKTEWFTIWHKSLRQLDYFVECFQKERMVLLKGDDLAKFKFLKNKFTENQELKRDKDSLFTSEYLEYLELWSLKDREVLEKSICGNLDSILYNTICIDKNALYNAFIRTFTNYSLDKEDNF